jgi:hypothetical protein
MSRQQVPQRNQDLDVESNFNLGNLVTVKKHENSSSIDPAGKGRQPTEALDVKTFDSNYDKAKIRKKSRVKGLLSKSAPDLVTEHLVEWSPSYIAQHQRADPVIEQLRC